MNEPAPEPLVVLLLSVVGLADVLQHTPRVATVAAPTTVTFPPEEAVVDVMEVILVVVTMSESPTPVEVSRLAMLLLFSAPLPFPVPACTPKAPITTPSRHHPKTVRTFDRFLMITPLV